jgi:hypothetical protein
MRADAIGFFWQDLPPPKKEKKEAVVRVAPEPVWLKEDYLPGLEEALRFPVELMTDADIIASQQTKDRFVFDTECYRNYWCIVFRSLATGKALIFEKTESNIGFEREDLFRWVLENITLVSFNGIHYDLIMVALAIDGVECDVLKAASDDLIVNNIPGWQILKRHQVKALKCDHIDLIEVAPDRVGLKTYGGRMHVPRMQDLPFHPHATLTPQQISIVRWYCVNDTTSTAFLHETLKEEIDLRYRLSEENGIDLRSKSDAQIAEAIIAAEYQRRTGMRAQRPRIEPGTQYFYEKPANLRFQSAQMQEVLRVIQTTPFEVGLDGKIQNPEAMKKLTFKIGETEYKMGIGGLHSKEKSVAHISNEEYQLVDHDVTSYYPYIILNNMYFPEHLGPVFLQIFGSIVERRVRAKIDGLKAIAQALKIVINGTFGKLGSAWSIVYAPKLMFHTTIGGQLYLLMLAEAYEMNGIRVVSANTDGIMSKCPRHLLPTMKKITKWWEEQTGFKMESKNYNGLYSRDINNYIAVDEELNVKSIGAYRNPWDDPKEPKAFRLKKNPFTTICIYAVWQYLTKKLPLEQTIWECKDIRKFTGMRSVPDGAVKDGEYLGKQIRWYYSINEREKEIIKSHNGHKVGRSDGARPLMELPNQFPEDVDYDWYLEESKSILKKIGVTIN